MVEFFPHEQNFIRSIVTHGCARPWYVYLETFIPSFIELFLTVHLFDVEDALRAHGKQIAARGGRRTGRGGRHAPRRRVSGFKPAVNRYAAKGLGILLVVTQPLEFIGLAWLIYAATDRFFFNWQTLLEASPFCTQPIVSGPMQRSRRDGFIGILPGGAVTPMPIALQNRGSWPNNDFGVGLPEGAYTAVFALTVTGPLFGVNNVRVRLRVTRITGTFFIEGDAIDIGGSEVVDLVVRGDFFIPIGGGGAMAWELAGQAVPAGIFCTKGNVLAMRIG